MVEGDNVKYKVVFLGPPTRDIGVVDRLAKNLQVGLRLSRQSVAKIMYLAPVAVKKEVDLGRAQRLKAFLEKMGAAVKIEPMDVGGAQPKAETSEETVPTGKWAETMPASKWRERIPVTNSHTLS